jgi:hypothetical protein
VFGNWQFNFVVEASSGTNSAMPDATPIRDPKLPAGQQTVDRWFQYVHAFDKRPALPLLVTGRGDYMGAAET